MHIEIYKTTQHPNQASILPLLTIEIKIQKNIKFGSAKLMIYSFRITNFNKNPASVHFIPWNEERRKLLVLQTMEQDLEMQKITSRKKMPE